MLTPQEKVVIVAPRSEQRAVVEALHATRSAHFIEFHEGRDAHGLKLGKPLPEGAKASERLVRLRSLVRTLALEGREPSRTVAASDVKTKLKELEEREARLRPLAALPLRVEDYRGYDNLRPFVGTVAEPMTEADLAPLGAERVLFHAGQVVALFVPTARADAATEALGKRGFREMEVPALTGAPSEVIARGETEREELARKLAAAEAELQGLARDHGDFLLAAEEHLSIEVEKAEAPLAFGSTEYAFVVQAWVPTEDVPRVEAALRERLGDTFHFERAAPDLHGGHGHAAEPHDHAPPAGADSPTVPHEAGHDDAHGPAETPPTKYRNPAFARPFQFFTTMFSMPKYGEIDPTVVLSITFPLFYGFMISDLGYGTIMAVLGLWMAFRLAKIEGMRELGLGIAVAGVVAIVFGGLVFHDAFGIPFEAHVPESEIAEVEHHVAEHNAAHPDDHLTACQYFAEHHGETTWGCILSGQSHLAAGHPPLSKIGDVSTLLILSVLAALVHLTIGLVFGIANEAKHSMKHALAKTGWLLLLVGFTYHVLSVARYNQFIGARMWFPAGVDIGYPDGSVAHGAVGLANVAIGSFSVIGMEVSYLFVGLFLVGLALLVVTEGGIALLEIPSLLANLLSYTRLAGVAVAKAAMAAAFNALFLVGMVLDPHAGILLVVIGGLLVVVTQSVVLVLGLLSSGIQAIRLNYVEFFTKFYKGGGTPFRPFGRERRFTTEIPTP